ncbi:MAG: SRPBCC family protein [Anaerolineales bacterium]|nr:SRPBCC family protein [Anaerolineales bacterium]
MIVWSSSIDIRRPPEVVFDLLANIQDVQQSDDSPVLALDLITEGPPCLGSRYREVVQMMPLVKGEIISEITAFDPPRLLEMTWRGPGMTGTDRYELASIEDGATLYHKKCVSCPGVLRMLEPFMRIPLIPRLEERLEDIKRLLEGRDNQ